MARIGSAGIQLLRPEFSESNRLYEEAGTKLLNASKPFEDAMTNNFAYMKQQKSGELSNMLQQIAPQDPSNPEAMQQYLQQAQDMAQESGLNNWGINTGVAINVADALVDRNQGVAKLQGANTTVNLANQETEETNQFNQLATAIRAAGGSNNDIMAAAAKTGISVDVAGKILANQKEAVGIAGTVQKSNTDLIAAQNALEQIKAAVAANNNVASAQQVQQANMLTETIRGMQRDVEGGGGGKDLGVSSGSTGTSNSSFKDKLIQSESSGNSSASITIKDGRQFGGLMQLGTARLKDYANATKTRAMTADQFRKLPAAQQEIVNNWHIGSLTTAAKNTGAIGKTIKGMVMTEDALVAMAHLGGTGGMQKFVNTNGRYNPSDQLGTSLTDYAKKFGGGGSVGGGGGSGGSSGGINFNVSEFIDKLQMSTGNANTADNTKQLLASLQDRAAASSTLLQSSPRIDLDSAALPGFIGNSTGSASDAMKLFTPQEQFLKDDNTATLSAINSSSTAQIADITATSDMLKYNSAVETVFDARLRKAREEAAANGGGNIPISKLIGGSPARLKQGKEALALAGYTPEAMAQLPAETKTLIFNTLNDYLDSTDPGLKTNALEVEKEQRGAVKNLKEFPEAYEKATVQFLDKLREPEIGKWLEEESPLDQAAKWATPFQSVKQRKANINKLNTYMVKTGVKTVMENLDKYGTIVNPRDLAGVLKNATEIYKAKQSMSDQHGFEDLNGYVTKPLNPGQYQQSVVEALNKLAVEKEKKWGKLNATKIVVPFPERIQKALRNATVNAFGADTNK